MDPKDWGGTPGGMGGGRRDETRGRGGGLGPPPFVPWGFFPKRVLFYIRGQKGPGGGEFPLSATPSYLVPSFFPTGGPHHNNNCKWALPGKKKAGRAPPVPKNAGGPDPKVFTSLWGCLRAPSPKGGPPPSKRGFFSPRGCLRGKGHHQKFALVRKPGSRAPGFPGGKGGEKKGQWPRTGVVDLGFRGPPAPPWPGPFPFPGGKLPLPSISPPATSPPFF